MNASDECSPPTRFGGTAGAVAIIAYVGSAGSVDASSTGITGYKGLAIAMRDANNGSGCAFYTTNSGTCVSRSSDINTALGFLDGITCTTTLTSDGHTHAAATAAKSNNGTAKPTTGTSDWFLPSIGQWNLFFKGLATKAYSTNAPNLSIVSNTNYKVGDLNAVITAAGGNNLNVTYYQSSSQSGSNSSYNYNWVIDFKNGDGTCASGVSKTSSYYVRSVLAF